MYVGTVKLNRFFCDPMRSYNHYRSGSHMSSFQHFFNILVLLIDNRGYFASFMISLFLIYIEINRGIKLKY